MEATVIVYAIILAFDIDIIIACTIIRDLLNFFSSISDTDSPKELILLLDCGTFFNYYLFSFREK